MRRPLDTNFFAALEQLKKDLIVTHDINHEDHERITSGDLDDSTHN